MMLIMTMNGWVCLSLAFGLTIGYAIDTLYVQQDKEKIEPI